MIGLSPQRLGWDRGNWARAGKQVGSFRWMRTGGGEVLGSCWDLGVPNLGIYLGARGPSE